MQTTKDRPTFTWTVGSPGRKAGATSVTIPDCKWKDFYRIGAVASFLIGAFIIVAIAAFFIWPYSLGLRRSLTSLPPYTPTRCKGSCRWIFLVPSRSSPFHSILPCLQYSNASMLPPISWQWSWADFLCPDPHRAAHCRDAQSE